MLGSDALNGDLSGLLARSPLLSCPFLVLLMLFLAVGCGVESKPTEETDLSLERGRALYGKLCQTCHGEAVTGAGGEPAAPVHGPQGHTWHHPDGQLEAIILGQFTYPGRTMPSFDSQLSEEEVAAILAYLKEGWTTEQREVQAEASRNWEEYQSSGQ
jgi:mono/diheme cytochrome c family protein